MYIHIYTHNMCILFFLLTLNRAESCNLLLPTHSGPGAAIDCGESTSMQSSQDLQCSSRCCPAT